MKKNPKFHTKAIVFEKKEKAVVVDNIACPEVDNETVVIHTKISGLSRGTETDMYTGQLHNPDEYHYPIITGYEPVGEVAFAGKKITHVKEGDLVLGHNLAKGYLEPYCSGWGGAVEYAVYSRESAPVEWYTEEFCAGRRVVRVPEGLEAKDAIFGTLAGVALHGVQRVDVKPQDTVTIIGLGVIGNCAAQFCQNIGAKVIAFDLYPYRCKIAEKCGVQHAVNAKQYNLKEVVNDYTGGLGADVVIECSGEVSNIGLSIEIAANYGRIHLQGAYLQPYPLIVQRTLFPKNLALTSSCGATPLHITELFSQILKGKLIVKPMLTKLFPVSEAQSAYQLALHHPDKSVKLGFIWR